MLRNYALAFKFLSEYYARGKQKQAFKDTVERMKATIPPEAVLCMNQSQQLIHSARHLAAGTNSPEAVLKENIQARRLVFLGDYLLNRLMDSSNAAQILEKA